MSAALNPGAIASAIDAIDALGLAGSSAMTGFVQMAAAQTLVARIRTAQSVLMRLYSPNAAALTDAEHRECDAMEALIDEGRRELRRLIANRIGVGFDDLEDVL
jgi:hypothetical protein